MLDKKDHNYLDILNKIRRKRNRDNDKKLVLIAVFVLLLIAAIAIGVNIFGDKGTDVNVTPEVESTEEQTDQTTKSAEELEAEKTEAEKEAVVNSYTNLGIVQVNGYLNIRDSASTDADVIGKLQGDSACEILDDSTEGWFHVSSGGLDGFISSEFVLTGDEAKEKARELVAPRAIVKADKMNIRKEPSIESDSVGQAVQHERYAVVGETDGWVEISTGFLSAEFVEVRYALNEARKLDLKSMVFNLYDNLGISNVDSYLNVRKEPKEDSEIVGKMTSKSAGDILEKTEDGGWYKIKSGPVTGYVKSDYILTGSPAKDEALTVAELMAIVSTDRLNVRTEPTTEAPIWTQISNNERYSVINQTDGWVEIELDSTSAFVSTDFVDVRYALPEAVTFSALDGNTSLRNKIVNYGLQFLGNRYVWGGTNPNTGADCSGFVQYVYRNAAGISLNRTSREQAKQGTKINSSNMRPGDLIFYTDRNGTVNHVAMYIGNGQIVHAANRKSGIKISTWNYRNPYRIANIIGD